MPLIYTMNIDKLLTQQLRTFIWLRSRLRNSKKPEDKRDLVTVEEIIHQLKQEVKDEIE